MLCAWWPTLLHGVTYVIILATKSFSGYHESIPDTLILTIMRALVNSFWQSKKAKKQFNVKRRWNLLSQNSVSFWVSTTTPPLQQKISSESPLLLGKISFAWFSLFFCSDQDCPINDIIRSYLRPTQIILLFTVRVNSWQENLLP